AVADQDGPAAGSTSRLDIAPAVSYHETFRQGYAVALRRPQQHAGLGLAAIAIVDVVVLAHFHSIKLQAVPQMLINRIGRFAGLQTAGDVGLVRHDDQAKSVAP